MGFELERYLPSPPFLVALKNSTLYEFADRKQVDRIYKILTYLYIDTYDTI